ncbi:uncharacterized protein LOC134846096 isoform X3 [Symsagittifera roscoffensis]|uniref:uncharacterized protein LOC134846096 isoform X3 n=1 Tax=Symsagittifera roscoffensis TaxID=84072 RepID=UPI00307BDFDE
MSISATSSHLYNSPLLNNLSYQQAPVISPSSSSPADVLQSPCRGGDAPLTRLSPLVTSSQSSAETYSSSDQSHFGLDLSPCKMTSGPIVENSTLNMNPVANGNNNERNTSSGADVCRSDAKNNNSPNCYQSCFSPSMKRPSHPHINTDLRTPSSEFGGSTIDTAGTPILSTAFSQSSSRSSCESSQIVSSQSLVAMCTASRTSTVGSLLTSAVPSVTAAAQSLQPNSSDSTITIKLQLYGFQNPGSFTASMYAPDCVLRAEMLEPAKYSTMPITFSNVPCDAVQQNATFSNFLSPTARHEFLKLLNTMAEEDTPDAMSELSGMTSSLAGALGGAGVRRKFPLVESPVYWLFNKTDRRAFCFSSKVCLEGNYLDLRGSSSAQLFIYVQLYRRHYWVRENFSESAVSGTTAADHGISRHPPLSAPSLFDPKSAAAAASSPINNPQQNKFAPFTNHTTEAQSRKFSTPHITSLFPALTPTEAQRNPLSNTLNESQQNQASRRFSTGDCFKDLVTSLYSGQTNITQPIVANSNGHLNWQQSQNDQQKLLSSNFANPLNSKNALNSFPELPQCSTAESKPSSFLSQLKDPKRLRAIEEKQNFLAKQHLNDLAESSVQASCVETEEVLEKFFRTPLAFNRSPPGSVLDKPYLRSEGLGDDFSNFGSWDFQNRNEIPLRIFVGNEGSEISNASFLNNNNVTPRSGECSRLLKLITDKNSGGSNLNSPIGKSYEGTPHIKQEPLSNYESQSCHRSPYSNSTQIMLSLLDQKRSKLAPKVAPLQIAPFRSLNAAENEQISDDVILSPDYAIQQGFPDNLRNNRPMTLLQSGMNCFNGAGMVQVASGSPSQMGMNSMVPRVVNENSLMKMEGGHHGGGGYPSPGNNASPGVTKKRSRLPSHGPHAKRQSMDHGLSPMDNNNRIMGMNSTHNDNQNLNSSTSHRQNEKRGDSSSSPSSGLDSDKNQNRPHCQASADYMEDLGFSFPQLGEGDDIDEMIQNLPIDDDFLNDLQMSRNDIPTPPSGQSGDSCATFPGTSDEGRSSGGKSSPSEHNSISGGGGGGGSERGAAKCTGARSNLTTEVLLGKQHGANLKTSDGGSTNSRNSERKRSVEGSMQLPRASLKLNKSNSFESDGSNQSNGSGGKLNAQIIGSKTLSELLGSAPSAIAAEAPTSKESEYPGFMFSRVEEKKMMLNIQNKKFITPKNDSVGKNNYSERSLFISLGRKQEGDANVELRTLERKASRRSSSDGSESNPPSYLNKVLNEPIEEYTSEENRRSCSVDMNDIDIGTSGLNSGGVEDSEMAPLPRIKGFHEVAHELREAARKEEERDLQEQQNKQEFARQQQTEKQSRQTTQNQFMMQQHQASSNQNPNNTNSNIAGNVPNVTNRSPPSSREIGQNMFQSQRQQQQPHQPNNNQQQQVQQQQGYMCNQPQRPNSVAIAPAIQQQQGPPSVHRTTPTGQMPPTPGHNMQIQYSQSNHQNQMFQMSANQSEASRKNSAASVNDLNSGFDPNLHPFQQQNTNANASPILHQTQPQQQHNMQQQQQQQQQQQSPVMGGQEFKPFPPNLFRDPVNPPNQTIANFSAPGAMMRDQKSPQQHSMTPQVYVPSHCVNPPPNHHARSVNTPSIQPQQQPQQRQPDHHIHQQHQQQQQQTQAVKYYRPTQPSQQQIYVSASPVAHQNLQNESSMHQVPQMGSFPQHYYQQGLNPPMVTKRFVGTGYQPSIVRAPMGMQQHPHRLIRTPIDQAQNVPQGATMYAMAGHPQLHSPHIMNGAAFNRFPAQGANNPAARITQQGGSAYHLYSIPPSLSQPHPHVQNMHSPINGSVDTQQSLQSPGNIMRQMPPGMMGRPPSAVPQVYHMPNSMTPQPNQKQPPHIHHQQPPPPPQQPNGANTIQNESALSGLIQHAGSQAVAGPQMSSTTLSPTINTSNLGSSSSNNHINNINCASMVMSSSSNNINLNNQNQCMDRLQPMQVSNNSMSANSAHLHMTNSSSKQNQMYMMSTTSKLMHSPHSNNHQQQQSYTQPVSNSVSHMNMQQIQGQNKSTEKQRKSPNSSNSKSLASNRHATAASPVNNVEQMDISVGNTGSGITEKLSGGLKMCSSSSSLQSISSVEDEPKMTEQMEDLNSIYDDFLSTLSGDNPGKADESMDTSHTDMGSSTNDLMVPSFMHNQSK